MSLTSFAFFIYKLFNCKSRQGAVKAEQKELQKDQGTEFVSVLMRERKAEKVWAIRGNITEESDYWVGKKEQCGTRTLGGCFVKHGEIISWSASEELAFLLRPCMIPCAASPAQRSSFLSVGTPVGAEQLAKSKVVLSDRPLSPLQSHGEPRSEWCMLKAMCGRGPFNVCSSPGLFSIRDSQSCFIKPFWFK